MSLALSGSGIMRYVTGIGSGSLLRVGAGGAIGAGYIGSYFIGTANQLTWTGSSNGTVQGALPQSIATASSPTFAGLTVSSNAIFKGDDLTVVCSMFGGMNISGRMIPVLNVYQTAVSTGRDAFYVQHASAAAARYLVKFIANAAATPTPIFTAQANGAIAVATALTVGSEVSITGAGAIYQVKATAPSVAASGMFSQYADDVTSGQTVPHWLTGNNKILRLFQGSVVTSATGGAVVDTEARAAVNALIAHLQAMRLLP